jgi:hypothetical protein
VRRALCAVQDAIARHQKIGLIMRLDAEAVFGSFADAWFAMLLGGPVSTAFLYALLLELTVAKPFQM